MTSRVSHVGGASIILLMIAAGLVALLPYTGMAQETAEITEAESPSLTAAETATLITTTYTSSLQSHVQKHQVIITELKAVSDILAAEISTKEPSTQAYLDQELEDINAAIDQVIPYIAETEIPGIVAELVVTPVLDRPVMWVPHREAFYNSLRELDSIYTDLLNLAREIN